MGRTNPTYRDRLRALEESWGDFRRALRAEEKAHFDRLFEHARAHADAAGYQNATDPVIPMLVSVLLAQEREVAELRERVDELEEYAGEGEG